MLPSPGSWTAQLSATAGFQLQPFHSLADYYCEKGIGVFLLLFFHCHCLFDPCIPVFPSARTHFTKILLDTSIE